MSTGQKIRKLAIKIDKLNKELKDLQNQHLENKKECNCEKSWPADFDNKHDRYKNDNSGDNIISYQTCESLKDKIKQLEKERDDYKFAAEINYKKFEALNTELIVRANKNIKIDDEIIIWLKNLSEGKYDNYKVNIYEKENAKKLLKQLGINNE